MDDMCKVPSEKKKKLLTLYTAVKSGMFMKTLSLLFFRAEPRKEPKKLITQTSDQTGSQVNFYYGAAPYAESIAPSHHSTYAHYYDDEEDGWEMPNYYNETYMKGVYYLDSWMYFSINS